MCEGSGSLSIHYENFELQIGPRSGDRYLVRVIRSPAGQGEGFVEHPLVATDLDPGSGAAREVRPRPAGAPAVRGTLVETGSRLFRTVFADQIGSLFYQSLSGIGGAASGCGLRICLRINPRDRTLASLHQVPWELLYREDTEDFLALSRQTPVVRSLDIPRPSVLPPLKPPLRILIVLSQAAKKDPLDLGDELGQLGAILRQNPDVEVEVLDSPDSRALRRALSGTPVHVLHFMGHGGFDPRTGEGTLLFAGPEAGGVKISGQHLATKIKDLGSLRLVVLNACSTARSSADAGRNPFSGVATALVLGGVPAVVAMQSPIADPHAIAFSTAFYERLAGGLAVDEAVTEGRQAIHSLAPDGSDWAIPVLFMRTPSGTLGFKEKTPPAVAAEKQPAPRSRVRTVPGALLLAVLLTASGLVMWLADPMHWFRGAPEEPAPPVVETAEGSESPAKTTEPAAVPIPMVVNVGDLRFEIVGDRSGAFARALPIAAKPLTEPEFTAEISKLAGRTIRIELADPRVSPVTQADLSWQSSCRMTASFRLRGVELSAEGVRTHADETKACALAAERLADDVVRKLAQHLQEEESK